MVFVDYFFEKAGDNIRFDKELNPATLGVESGDVFRAVIDENNRLILVKVKENK